MKDERQIEILKELYEFNEEDKSFIFNLQYESVYDILDKDISTCEKPRFSNAFLNRISELIDDLPKEFKADIKLNIKDYEGYDPNVLALFFDKAIELNRYESKIESKKKSILSIGLIIIGILLITFLLVGENQGIFGSESNIEYGIITTILDIASWVFIWEAVALLFLEVGEKKKLNLKLLLNINSISFLNNGNELSKIDRKEVLELLFKQYKFEDRGRKIMLFSGTALIVSGFWLFITQIYNLVSGLKEENSNSVLLISIFIISLLICAFNFICGIIGCSSFSKLKEPFKVFTMSLVTSLLILNLSLFILNICYFNASNIVQSIFGIMITIFYIVGFVLLETANKINKKRKEK